MPETLVAGLIGAGIGLLVGGSVTVLWMSSRVTALTADRARMEAELGAARQSQSQIRETFSALSHDALLENREDFLRNARDLLTPVRDTLTRVQDQLAAVDKHREGSYRAVSAQLTELSGAQKELRDAADGLQRSLRSPATRGKWGEFQLRRIVELAGMTSNCDFEEKPSTATEDGSRLTPDLVVRLPGDATIVLDAKVPIDAYLAAAEATSDAERQQKLGAHVRQVREHIRTLGAKEYWKQFPRSPEFVVLFLPLEPLLAAAVEQDKDLLDQAVGLRVIPATPLTLLALLKTVALGWQQEKIARNAEEIQVLGRELYERMALMVGHLQGVGDSIKQAGDAYDRLVGSLERRVLPGARRFKDLGVQASSELESPELLRLSLRPVSRQGPAADDRDDAAEVS